MTRQQIAVFELLRGLATEQLRFHEWYHGAIQVLSSQSPDKTAQAAHSIRELCDRLPNRIAGIPTFKNPVSAVKQLGPQFSKVKERSYQAGWKGEIINEPLAEVLRRVEEYFAEPPRTRRFARALTSADPQAYVLSTEWREGRDDALDRMVRFFQGVAHHNSFVTETEIREKLEIFDSLLLNYLTPCTAAQQAELLALAAAAPNPHSVTRVAELTSHKAANFAFFLEKLDNPAWLPALEEMGWFRDLPEPEDAPDGKIIYRHHLPLIALTRTAEADPQAVTNILKKLRLPNNPCVGDQVLQCLARIRNPASVRQLGAVTAQLGENPARTSWLHIQELLKSWMELETPDELFAVIQGCLNRAVDVSSSQLSNDHNSWLIKQIDKECFEQLSSQYPLELAAVLFQALSRWANQERLKYSQSELADDSPSSYWLEDFKTPPPIYRGAEATLAMRLFSTAGHVYRHGDASNIDALERLLRSHPWQLFRRLRCQLYADFPVLSLQRARAELLARMSFLNRIDYSCGSHDYEFAQLLSVHVKTYGGAFLPTDEVEQFACLVQKGPIRENGDFVESCRDVFIRKQLWPIASLLEGEHLAAYRALVPDDKQINIQSYKPFRPSEVLGGEIVSVAPPQADMLGEMDNEHLWNFLRTWQPSVHYPIPGSRVQEDIFALAAKFAELVERTPERFAATTNWWENITRSEILDRLLERAGDRLSKKQEGGETLPAAPSESDWTNWLGVIRWAMRQFGTRDAVTQFIRKALQSDHVIPDRYLSEFPEILRRLIQDEDPRLHGMANSFRDWFTTAINSTRGEAIEALLNLALRQKNAGIKIDSRIFEIIQSRLELQDESPATFALLGAKLRLLIHLFGSKTSELGGLLFSADRPEHCSAALTAHFKYDQPWDAILNTFPEFISRALHVLALLHAEAKDGEIGQEAQDIGSRLGTHIACYYWSGSFPDDAQAEAALDRFFSIAAASIRATAIGQIAAIWENTSKEPTHKDTISRVMRIWERRYAQIAKQLESRTSPTANYDGELAQFTEWLSCECFPFEWRVANAKSALERLKTAPRAYHLLKVISEFGVQPSRLEASLQLLRMLLSKPGEEFRWSIQFKDLAPVLSLGLKSENADVARLAKKCQDMLLKRGFSDFLNLGNEGGN